MMDDRLINVTARQHFSKARSRARRSRWIARFTGRDRDLLPFDEIRALLRRQNPLYQGVQPIPLAQIAGSVGRYQDFDRHFLPLKDSLENRWVNIEALAVNVGWLPIETYQVGDVYFVRDGNHRVAVARQMGLPTIESHVWAFPEELHIGPDESQDEVLIRFGEQRFLQETNLDVLRPDHGIRFTSPGRYPELQAQIAEMQEKLAYIDGESPSSEYAVTAWYDLVYIPAVQIIRETDLLAAFPGRTEADLFVWLSAHRQELMRRYGTHDHLCDLAASLAGHYREPGLARMWRRFRRVLGFHNLPALQDPDYESPHPT